MPAPNAGEDRAHLATERGTIVGTQIAMTGHTDNERENTARPHFAPVRTRERPPLSPAATRAFGAPLESGPIMPIAVVTGAASGIGRALAVALARSGHTLALADQNEAGLQDTIALLPDRAIAAARTVDVADRAAVDAFARDVVARHGGVDLLINNAGVSIAGTVDELTVDEMAWVVNVNFWGVVHGVKAFLPSLLARGSATIVNVSSVFGLWGPPGQSAYAASKFAVRGFSESLRAELRDSGVHVVTVHPAGIKTAIARTSRIAAGTDRALAERRRDQFDRRLLTIPPERAARAILDGVAKRRDRVLIGADAYRIDWITRLLGPRGSRMLSNVMLRGIAKNAS